MNASNKVFLDDAAMMAVLDSIGGTAPAPVSMIAEIYNTTSALPVRTIHVDPGLVPETTEQEDKLFDDIADHLTAEGFEFTCIRLVAAPAETPAPVAPVLEATGTRAARTLIQQVRDCKAKGDKSEFMHGFYSGRLMAIVVYMDCDAAVLAEAQSAVDAFARRAEVFAPSANDTIRRELGFGLLTNNAR
jgi:hypothetical protein